MKLFVTLLLVFVSSVLCSEELKEAPVLTFFYDTENCTDSSIYQISYFDSCNPFSRVEINSTMAVQYLNDDESVSLCSGDQIFSEEPLNKCQKKDNGNSIKFVAYDQKHHSNLFNMPCTAIYTIYASQDCNGNKYINVMYLNKEYKNDDILEFKNKSSNGMIETYECKEKGLNNCKKTDVQGPASCLLSKGFYYSFDSNICTFTPKPTEKASIQPENKTENTTKLSDVLNPEKNKGIPSIVYDFGLLVSIVSAVILVL